MKYSSCPAPSDYTHACMGSLSFVFKSALRVVFAFFMAMTMIGCTGDNSSSNTNNKAPIPDAGVDRVVAQGAPVALDGSSSSDEDGWIVSYHWVQTSGTGVALTNADTASPDFIAPQTNSREVLVFRLTVKDDDGAQRSDLVSITINMPPFAEAGSNQELNLSDPGTITLTGSSSDSDGVVVSHRWLQTAGPSVLLSGAETTTASFISPATTAAYTFSYTVTDNDGSQAIDTVSIYVARIIQSDSFSDGAGWANRWTIVDQTGKVENWQETEGRLRQTSNLDSAYFNSTSYHLGTYAVAVNSTMPASYRFSVDIKPLTDSSGRQGNDVGIMFRYLDANNYYRVSRSARFGYTRFEKRTNGNFQTLAVNAIGYVDNQPMNMTAEVKGDVIIVWIDGDAVFAAVDTSVSSGSVALYCADSAEFDNVLITENSLQPQVVLSAPLAYSIALNQDDGDTLAVEAIVLNKPAGGSVGFTLFDVDSGGSVNALGTNVDNSYSVEFPGVTDGEHDLMAVLKDADGREVAVDINSTVGTGGDYLITLGDSITNGIGDLNPLNNESIDGRIVAIQGYQAELADLLTTTTGRPQVVFNEGIGGDRASELENRINSIRERHPGANKVLLMIGTNDSGWPIAPVEFNGNVISALNKLSGLQVWLAKTMPTFDINTWTLDAGRNAFIEQYNDIMENLAAGNLSDSIFQGPDFYSIFNTEALYDDYLHPNDAGYSVMAEEWNSILTQ